MEKEINFEEENAIPCDAEGLYVLVSTYDFEEVVGEESIIEDGNAFIEGEVVEHNLLKKKG